MKGIILAGGSGTRLAPLTNVISKQLLPVYDKPMICYPLATLMNLGIKEILIISTELDTKNIENFLGCGKEYGIKLSYKTQKEPKGIADAFLIGEDFIGSENVCLILGDNIFYGSEISGDLLENKLKNLGDEIGAYIFAYHVSDPQRYGIVNYDYDEKKILSLEEKPKYPKSNWAVTGLYFYDSKVVDIAKNLKPSDRGELEITDVNKEYLRQERLDVVQFKRGFAWLDAGTPDSLIESAQFIQTIEKRQDLKIACLEEISYRKSLISPEEFKKLIKKYKKNSPYRQYLDKLIAYDRI